MSLWPFITKRRHMREYTELSRAYQAEIRVAKYERDRARADLVQWARQFGAPREIRRDQFKRTVVVVLEFTEELIRRRPPGAMAEAVSHAIVGKILGLHNDHRGDLRQDDAARMLGLRR